MTAHDDLKKLLEIGRLEPYLRHIRFPSYKNLEPGLRIEFTHPVTALVGPNGTNKTSILRALQGCRDGQSPGRYWFGTKLDVIDPQTRPRIIHGWIAPSTGSVVEALKERSPRNSDPDYWEPAQSKLFDQMEPIRAGVGKVNTGPRIRDGERSKDRWNAIDKRVKYLDFRSELSAFDKFFFHDSSREDRRAKRRTIRTVSPHILNAIDSRRASQSWYGKERIISPARKLNPTALSAVSEILGRQYSAIELFAHSFFTVTGMTARLHSNTRTYSEAFAGSGEFAAVVLVDAFDSAKPKTLFLLDEPEVSLHPGAQYRLMSYVLDSCKRGNHQVILATHSPALVEGLPPDAIKVLEINAGGVVVLRSQASSAIAAFETLGQKFAKPTVLVEDNLAAEIVRAAIRTDPQLSVTTICVQVLPGGANGLKRAAIDLALSTSASVGIIFDGDQLMAESIESSRVAEDNLNSAILRFAGSSVEKTLRGMASGSAVSSDDPRRVFVDWWHSHVSFLPSSWPPEDWLTICVGESQANENYWVDLATTELSLVEGEKVNSDDILATQRRCLARLDPAHLAPVVASVRAVLGI